MRSRKAFNSDGFFAQGFDGNGFGFCIPWHIQHGCKEYFFFGGGYARFACIGAGAGAVDLFWVRGNHVGFGLESGSRLCHTVGFYCEVLVCLI